MTQRDLALAALISQATGNATSAIARKRAMSGGCIHRVELIELADGRRYCVKSNSHAGAMFEQEAAGLAAIAEVGCLSTPRVVAVAALGGDEQCLILEAIEGTHRADDFWSHFGSGLAEHHRRGTSPRFGWPSDNYIGASPQKNAFRDSWLDFFRECRLDYQLRLARQRGLGASELFRYADRVLQRLDRWLGEERSQASLLHGDLWSGNFLVDAHGHAVVIDPAVYYGHREAELAMPVLFGGFPDEFFSAYCETWPLTDGWRERVELYKLYHLLNHLNLFGAGYLDSCVEIVKRFGS